MNNQFDWVPIYKEFAQKLLPYKNKRPELIEKIRQAFVKTQLELPMLEIDNKIVDIDPFTVFSLFNKKIQDKKRIDLLKAFSQLLGLQSSIPTSFDGIPVLTPQRAAYYPFGDKRKENDIDTLWALFEAALRYEKDPSEENKTAFSDLFTESLNIKYVGFPKLTMGLFWIAPETYINLDRCNTNYIKTSNKFPKEYVQLINEALNKPAGPVYLDIIEKTKGTIVSDSGMFGSFKELSYAAWVNDDHPSGSIRYWLYSPGENAGKWEEFYEKGIMAINWQKMGDLSSFSDREEMRAKMKELYGSNASYTHDSLATWEFASVMKPGDIIYAKKGSRDLVGRGIVKSEYKFDDTVPEYGHVREVEWTNKGEWKNAFRKVQKALTEITEEKDYQKLEALFIDDDEWWPTSEEYSPGFSKEDWLKVLKNQEIIGPVWGGALAAFYSFPNGAATCTQVGKKYNRSPYGISGICTNLAKRIHKETNCPIGNRDNGQNRYWTILFQGKNAGSKTEGNYIWKLRPELYDALTEFNIMQYEWDTGTLGSVRYWWLNANPKIWRFSNISVGDSVEYTFYNENGNKRRVFQNFLDSQAGDLIIGYEGTPIKKIVALARIAAVKEGEEILVEKAEDLENPIDYSILKESPELKNMEYFQNPQGTLYKLTDDEYQYIMDVIREENPIQKEPSIDVYTQTDFLKQVYMKEEDYLKIVAVLRNKKNIILQGAPGVGKTYAAKRLAYSMMGRRDEDRIEVVQFHQNYSYEDFVMGYKPVEKGFELKYGIFYRFCKKAENHPENDYFFIIDEINRGNMSKIFGELLMLIEKDHRKDKVTLAYDGFSFSVPENLYIIGMMNTADRSLAMIDYALRRRFSFIDMEPGFDSEQFIAYQNSLTNTKLNNLIAQIKILNQEIAADKSLGKGFCIGHSYFCEQKECTDEWLYSVVNYDILPMLREYWFDDESRVRKWEDTLQGVLK